MVSTYLIEFVPVRSPSSDRVGQEGEPVEGVLATQKIAFTSAKTHSGTDPIKLILMKLDVSWKSLNRL